MDTNYVVVCARRLVRVSRVSKGVSKCVGPLLLAALTIGCLPDGGSPPAQGPETVVETSDSRVSLEDKITFLEQYVSFERTYEQLEYDVVYFNNSGFPPGPSDWSIKVLAVVPTDELDSWVLPDAQGKEVPSPTIFSSIPGDINTQEITEWFVDSQRIVGIDRANSIVFYWNTTDIQQFFD